MKASYIKYIVVGVVVVVWLIEWAWALSIIWLIMYLAFDKDTNEHPNT